MKKRGYIYILLHESKEIDYIKVGYTCDLKVRYLSYKAYNPTIKLLYSVQLTNAKEFEELLHKSIESIYKNEWYDVSQLELIKSKIESWNSKFPLNEKLYEPIKDKSIRTSSLDRLKNGKVYNFKELCLQYHQSTSYFERDQILTYEPLIKEAFERLGFDKIKALLFIKKSINKELIKLNKMELYQKEINSYLNLGVNEWYSCSEIKQKLSEVYKTMSINKLPKVRDLFDYSYNYIDKQKKVNKINVKGILITENKI